MANIYDYLRWRGDLTFEERPFNDVDNIVLSALSYLDFTGIVPSEEMAGSIELSQACRKLIDICGGDVSQRVRSLAKIDTRFVELLMGSRRFGPTKLSAYVDEMDESRSLQFAAIQIDLSVTETYVAFRGTDDTLIGWREDFMLSFDVTEAQRLAVRYLEHAIERCSQQGRRVRVGGHSKGGNLAEYAAVCCREDLREHILMVYSNDGPGIDPEVMEQNAQMVLGPRMRHIVPTYSVIGMLFARKNDKRIIAGSTGSGLIGQHDPTTWKVTWSGVDEVLDLLQDCKVLNEAIAKWMQRVPMSERKRVTNEVFDALAAGGATRLDEIASTSEGLQKVLRALSKVDERTRELAVRLMESTVNTATTAARKSASNTLESWKKGMQMAAEDAARKLFGSPSEGKAT